MSCHLRITYTNDLQCRNRFHVMMSSCCVPDASVQLVALTSTTPPVLRPIVWLLTKHHPVEANDVYRQMCRIRTERPATVLIDFLDLSHDESATSESPYCIYWPGNHTCAERASSRQIFFVHNTLTASSFTLLFWSKNYSTTTTARFWIAITGNLFALDFAEWCLRDRFFVCPPVFLFVKTQRLQV